MLKRMFCKQLWFFLPVILLGVLSCEKKSVGTVEIPGRAQPGDTETAKIDKTSELEKTVPIVEGPYLNENNVVVKEPVPGILPVNPYKDVIQNNIDLDDVETVLKIYNWDMGFENSVIDFKTHGEYLLGHHTNDGFFAIGDYEVNGNNVLMYYPHEIQDGGDAVDFYGPRVLKWLFDGKKETVLVYDKTYKTYSVVTCLRHGDKILKNYVLQSPYGQEYEVNGLAVIKCNEFESRVEIKENLKMRKEPDVNADAVTLTVYREAILNEEGVTSNIVRSGEQYAYDQKTVKQDTIDGITAPWYRIIVIISDYNSASVWVFGGYLREFTPEEVNELRRERGWI
jgi:hypothetical protein